MHYGDEFVHLDGGYVSCSRKHPEDEVVRPTFVFGGISFTVFVPTHRHHLRIWFLLFILSFIL